MVKSRRAQKTVDVASRIERECIDKGMKMTGQRRVIARVLSEARDHPDVEEVYRRASDIDDHISIATVYRTLRLFDIANIIDRLDFGDGRARYELADDEGGHHHHLIDMRTGKVVEFESAELEAIKQRIARDLGYEMVGDRLEIYGVPLDKRGKDDK